MPTPVFMAITGAKQGNITSGASTEDSIGNDQLPNHADEIIVQGLKHSITIPRDPLSGSPKGTRVHQPMVITKWVDKSSPLLYNALTSGENLPEVTLKWFRRNMQGGLEHYFTTKLTDATIVDIHSYVPNLKDQSLQHFGHMEDISMVYRAIDWTHEIASTSGTDDYRSV